MAKTAKTLAVAALLSGFLGACASTGPSTAERAALGGYWVSNVAQGSGFEKDMPSGVRVQMMRAMGEALEDPKTGNLVRWAGPDLDTASLRGAVRVGEPFVTGVESASSARLAAPLGLDTSSVLEPDAIPVRVTTKSNVRLGPSLQHASAIIVEPGTVLTLRGFVKGTEWALVTRGRGRGTQVLGYMMGSLLERAEAPKRRAMGENQLVGGEAFKLEGGEEAFDLDSALAGAVARKPRLCRDFEQTLTILTGSTYTWEGTACRIRERQWEVVDVLETLTPARRPAQPDVAG